ncbi:hypothetical protein P7C70_g4867, partial [Phenoliferia sp. Uapishka_3]
MSYASVIAIPDDFPPELLIEIFSHLRSPAVPDTNSPDKPAFDPGRNSTLLSAALTCKEWSPCALDQLYTHLEIPWVKRKASSLMNALATHTPNLHVTVRSLRVQLVNEACWIRGWIKTGDGIRVMREKGLRYSESGDDGDQSWTHSTRSMRYRVEARHARGASVDKDWIDDSDGREIAQSDLWRWMTLLEDLRLIELHDFMYRRTVSSQLLPAQSFRRLEVLRSRNSYLDLDLSRLHMSDLKVIDVQIMISMDQISSVQILPALTHLRLSGLRQRFHYSLLDRMPTIAPEHLRALELWDPSISDLARIIERLPKMGALKSLVLHARQGLDPLRALEDDKLSNTYQALALALPSLPLQHLSISTWPAQSLLSILPSTLRSIAIDYVDRTVGVDFDDFAADLDGALTWGTHYLPALEVIEVGMRRIHSTPGMSVDLTPIIEKVGKVASGFELREAGQSQAPLPGKWMF